MRMRGTKQAHQSTPLLDAVFERGKRCDEVPLHVPGHQRGRNIHKTFQKVTKGALAFDTTELEGLDNLSIPTGVIEEAQNLACEAVGADRTWFLVNGSTIGIQASILALEEPDKFVLVSRDCHKSVFASLILADAKPIWVEPDINQEYGFASTSVSNFKSSIEVHANSLAGALVVCPNYYGYCPSVREISRECKTQKIPLIVDEAHGSHFAYDASFPQSALDSGADVVIQSTHKTLSAMTQAAMLHAKSELLDYDKLAMAVQMLQTSSPSYLLMASLDAARSHASMSSDSYDPSSSGQHTFYHACEIAHTIKIELSKIERLRVLGYEENTKDDGVIVDPLRITVCVKHMNITGYEVYSRLEKEYGVVAELATQSCVVFVITLSTEREFASRLIDAFSVISGQIGSSKHELHENFLDPSVFCSKQMLTPRQAFNASREKIAFRKSIGRVSLEMVCPYPPGIPILYPGELISPVAVEFLESFIASGGRVSGCSDPKLNTLIVLS